MSSIRELKLTLMLYHALLAKEVHLCQTLDAMRELRFAHPRHDLRRLRCNQMHHQLLYPGVRMLGRGLFGLPFACFRS